MQWNNHYRLRDTHAFLSASQWHWLRDDKEKLIKRYKSFLAVKEGDKLHKLAKALIAQYLCHKSAKYYKTLKRRKTLFTKKLNKGFL